MANTLTAITPILYEALDVVSREMTGMIPAVSRDSNAERAAVGQTVTFPVVPAISLEAVSPGTNPADSGDQTIGSGTMSIANSYVAPIRWTGEEQTLLSTGDRPQYRNVIRDQFAQGFRAIANAVEEDLAQLYSGAARAHGTVGSLFTTANDLTDVSTARAILNEKGAPQGDLRLVLSNQDTGVLRGKQPGLFHVNEAGTSMTLRDGTIGNLFGFKLHESGQIQTHTAGTNSGATTNAAGYAVGATTLTLASAGTGTIVTGDAITIATENAGLKYVVGTGDTDVSNGGTITLNGSGLKVAIGTSARAITTTASYRANMAFARSAIQLVTRHPAMPEGGDSADDVMNMVDPVSGLNFQVAIYRQYRRVKYEIGLAWGVKLVKADHVVLLTA